MASMTALRSFSFKHPRWTAWLVRLIVTAVIYVASSLVAQIVWSSGWDYKFFFAALFVGFSAEELAWRRYERERRAILERAERRYRERSRG
jgi:hypothetical protein